jgi:uncharacterized protein with HEPN domain
VPSRHDPAASLADILENLERIEDYVAGLDREAFRGDTSLNLNFPWCLLEAGRFRLVKGRYPGLSTS